MLVVGVEWLKLYKTYKIHKVWCLVLSTGDICHLVGRTGYISSRAGMIQNTKIYNIFNCTTQEYVTLLWKIKAHLLRTSFDLPDKIRLDWFHAVGGAIVDIVYLSIWQYRMGDYGGAQNGHPRAVGSPQRIKNRLELSVTTCRDWRNILLSGTKCAALRVCPTISVGPSLYRWRGGDVRVGTRSLHRCKIFIFWGVLCVWNTCQRTLEQYSWEVWAKHTHVPASWYIWEL